MDKPFPAYVGDQAYVFVCYAHEDRKLVYPELTWLREQGINIWYDEGISAGENWRAAIGDSLLGCSKFLFYLSARSLNSDHCNREINLALDEAKDVVPVYLEEVELTSDLMVGLNRVQALHRDQDESYRRHLLRALGRSIDDADLDRGAVRRTRKSWHTWAAAASVLLVSTLALGYYYRDTLLFALALNAPQLYFGDAIEQELGFVTTPDGTRIAYATSGEGSPIVQVQASNTHLESGQSSPIFDNEGLVAMSSRDHLFVRYDGRGFGLSDRDVDDFSLPALVNDLEAVVDALGLERFSLFAVSSAGPVAIAYAAEHPERVTRLALAGVMASYDWKDDEALEVQTQFANLIEVDWDGNPYVSYMLASMLLDPAGDEVDRLILGEMLRRSGDGATMASFMRSISQIDSRELAKQIRVPTLVISARNDSLVGMKAGRDLAALVPGSQFEIVEGGHMASSGSSPEARRRILDFFEMEQ